MCIRKTLLLLIVLFTAYEARAGNCSFGTILPVAFNQYSVFSTSDDSYAPPPNSPNAYSFVITCSPNTTVTLALDGGLRNSFPRAMQQSPSTPNLPYNLLTAPAPGGAVWGNGSVGTTVQQVNPDPKSSKTFYLPVYGIVTNQQDVYYSGAGYTDTVTITATWTSTTGGGGGGSATASLPVSVQVMAECFAQSAALAFGVYDPITTNLTKDLNSSTTLNLNCTAGLAPAMSFNYGANSGGTTTRYMVSGSSSLQYEIYKDSGYATIWNTQSTTSAVTSKSTNIGFGVWGKVPMAQNPAAGSYSDTLTATVNY